MQLGSLKTIFEKLDNDDFIFAVGFFDPMSYRGYYEQVAFEETCKISLKDVKVSISRALTESFTGYKGGEWTYDYATTAHVATYGGCSDDSESDLECLVGKMLMQYIEDN